MKCGRYLGPEKPKLSLHGPAARAVQLGQFELGRHELSHFAAEPEQTGRGGGVHDGEHADDVAVGGEGNHHA